MITTPTIIPLYFVESMENPHSKLVPLLEARGLTWASFSRRGRPPAGVRDKRAAIVTALHESGCTWAEMIEITGMSNGAIQRLTQAKGCAAVQKRRAEMGRRAGRATRGRRREWLTEQLKQQWADGKFDFHRGRVRSEAERDLLRAAWTPERRQAKSEQTKKQVWGSPRVRERLLAFHRSPQERARRSKLQVQRMKDNPTKYLRGRAAWVSTPKGVKPRTYVRSSYEVAAVSKLEADPNVVSYEYECRFVLPDGRWILPDFLVTLVGGQQVLVEVKSAWVFNMPSSHKVHRRLREAGELAAGNGWDFAIWTEKALGLL